MPGEELLVEVGQPVAAVPDFGHDLVQVDLRSRVKFCDFLPKNDKKINGAISIVFFTKNGENLRHRLAIHQFMQKLKLKHCS
jgi:hypothetical protein